MYKIILLILFTFPFAYTFATLEQATLLIADKKLSEAETILSAIMNDKNSDYSEKVSALRMLSTYPLGTNAYAIRHSYAKKLLEYKSFFSLLKAEDKIFILRTGGLGAFQSADWELANIFFQQLIEIGGAEEVALAKQYIGWIYINQKKYNDAITFWMNSLKKDHFSSRWVDSIKHDLGLAVAECLYHEKINLINVEEYLENEHFLSGFKEGLKRSNFEKNKYQMILNALNNYPKFKLVVQGFVFNDLDFAKNLPCMFFELNNEVISVDPKHLGEVAHNCWNILSYNKQISNTEQTIISYSKKYNIPQVAAEIYEKSEQRFEACIAAIEAFDFNIATRNCAKDKSKINDVKMRLEGLKEQEGVIGIWDQIFQSSEAINEKQAWLLKYYPIPDFIKADIRPLAWWFDLAINQTVPVVWQNYFLNSNADFYTKIKMSDSQKTHSLFSLGIKYQNDHIIIENAKSIEKLSNLIPSYKTWLNHYIKSNPTQEKNGALLFDTWIEGYKLIKECNQLKAKTFKYKSKDSNFIPDIALIFNNALSDLNKIDLLKFDLKRADFPKNINKSMLIMSKAISQLQKIPNLDKDFVAEAETIRLAFNNKIKEKIMNVNAPEKWSEAEKEAWKTEKNKMIQAIEANP